MTTVAELWLSVGEAAKLAGRDKRTIRRWVDQGLLTGRVSPGGHRQIAAASLDAVLTPTRPPADGDPGATAAHGGRVLTRWGSEARQLAAWVPSPRLGAPALEELLVAVGDVRAALDLVEDELRARLADLDAGD